MEVAMPTGSLCSERNAIGSALADNMSLKRSDILGVAVLFVNILSREKPYILLLLLLIFIIINIYYK